MILTTHDAITLGKCVSNYYKMNLELVQDQQF